jgi:hypothetical protein
MAFPRSVFASLLAFLMAFPFGNARATPAPSLGILTQAYQAHVDEALAFPGLSIFDGEELSTDLQGRIGVRVGHSVLTLAGSSNAAIFHITNGIHVDLTYGSVHFNDASGEIAEVHVGEALLRTIGNHPAQGSVTVLADKVLQVAAEKGGLNFSYRQDFRFLPEGQTYRIYLDAPAEPQVDAIDGGSKPGVPGKVAYFIVGAAVGGGAVWGIHELLSSGNPPISPAKP